MPTMAAAVNIRPRSDAAIASAIRNMLGPSSSAMWTDVSRPCEKRHAIQRARPRGVVGGSHRVISAASASQKRTFWSA